MAKSYFVTAPLVLAKNEAGEVQYLYKGAALPSNVTGDALKNLVDSGLVGFQDDLATRPPADVPAFVEEPKKAPAKATN